MDAMLRVLCCDMHGGTSCGCRDSGVNDLKENEDLCTQSVSKYSLIRVINCSNLVENTV